MQSAVTEQQLVEMRCEIIDGLHDEIFALSWERMVMLSAMGALIAKIDLLAAADEWGWTEWTAVRHCSDELLSIRYLQSNGPKQERS